MPVKKMTKSMTTSCLEKRNPGRTCCLCFLFSVNSPQLNAKTASTQEVLHLCFRCSPPREARRIVLKIPLTAGGANAASHEATPPRRMGMRHGGGTQCERSVFRAKRRRERVSAKPIERHQEVAEAMSRGARAFGRRNRTKAQASRSRVHVAAPCRSNAIHHAQRHQYYSATECKEKID